MTEGFDWQEDMCHGKIGLSATYESFRVMDHGWVNIHIQHSNWLAPGARNYFKRTIL